jgi:hypothetical protein
MIVTLPAATAFGGGGASGLTWLRSGISIGMSTATGRGWVSNSSGKPITPVEHQHHRAYQAMAGAPADGIYAFGGRGRGHRLVDLFAQLEQGHG